MAAPTRRDCLVLAGGLGAVSLLAATARALAQDADAQVVAVVAQRFHYTPAEIRVKAGRPVLLEFTALDFVHGFNMPALNLRADLVPGKVTRVRVPPQAAGTIEFLCDNFCGAGHEQMQGRMIVEA